MTATPQVADDCIACGAVFQPNTDLASVPRGRRVAWDLMSDRAWRICTRCGHWNLLGSEAGAILAAELASRLPGRATDGVTYELVGSVEVVVMAETASGSVGTRGAITAKRIAQWMFHPLAKLALSPIAVIAPIFVISNLGSEFRPLAVFHDIATIGVGLLFGGHLARRLLLKGKWNRPVIVGFGLAAVLLMMLTPLLAARPWHTPMFTASQLALMTILSMLLELFGPPFIPVVVGGKSRALTPFAARNAELVLAPDGAEIAVRSLGRLGDITIQGAAAERALGWLLLMGGRQPSLDDFEGGWLLARRHGSSAALLRALLATHADGWNGVSVRDIPDAWRAAFSVTITESQGDAKEREKLVARIREASDVAAIAERLEKDEGET